MRYCSSLAIAALVGLQAQAHAGPRAGFVNLARDAEIGQETIEELRTEARRGGAVLVDGESVREALEGPLSPETAPPEGAARARELLDGARSAYADFRYGDALQAVRRVDSLLAERVPTAESVEVLAESHLLAAVVHMGRDAPDRALAALRLVARLQPDRAGLDPGRYRPDLVALYDEARVLERESPRGDLIVATSPRGARVWVDGRAVGSGPIELEGVVAGEHYVAAEAPGTLPRARKVVTTGEELDRVELVLAPISLDAQLEAVRREALSGSGSGDAWASAARRLAALVTVDVLFLVRTGDGGASEVALYDVQRARLGAWLAAPSEELSEALAALSGREELVASVGASGAGEARPWYRTWWGKGLLVGGGLAVAGAVVYALSDSGSSGDYAIRDWCFDGNACP